QVAAERPTTLMLKVTYHPDWHAYVDGIETPTMMLMPSFIGVPIRPGTHEVRMEYQPQPLRHELMLLGLLALALTALAEWRREAIARVVDRLPLPELPQPRLPWLESVWGGAR